MIEMDSKKLLYEGKAKSVFQGENENEVIIDFREDMTEGEGARKEIMGKKGQFKSNMCSKVIVCVEMYGVETI